MYALYVFDGNAFWASEKCDYSQKTRFWKFFFHNLKTSFEVFKIFKFWHFECLLESPDLLANPRTGVRGFDQKTSMHFGLLKNAIILKKRDFESFFFIIWKLLLKFSKFSNFGISNACWNHRISWQILVQGYEDLTKKHHHRRELEHTFFGRGNAHDNLWKFMKFHEFFEIQKNKK